MTLKLWLIFLYIGLSSAQCDFYSNSSMNASTLIYEVFGKVFLANGHWEMVTWLNFQDYTAIYKYLLNKADKLLEFCASTNTILCTNGCDRLQYELERLNNGHDSIFTLVGISRPRVKRFWSEAAVHLSKIGQLPIESRKPISSKNPPPINSATYNKQVDSFQNNLNEVENYPEQRRTLFRLEKMLQWLNKSMDTLFLNKSMNTLFHSDGRRFFTRKSKELEKKGYLVLSVDKLENELNNFNSYKNKKQSFISGLKCDFEFSRLLISLLSTFNDEQTNFLEALKDANNGILNSYILPPPTLVLLLKYIQFNVPEGLSFPYYAIPENDKKLHRMIKPSFYMYKNKIIFTLDIPLVESDPYKIYRLRSFRNTSVPQEYDLEAPYLVVDRRYKEYQFKSVAGFSNLCKMIDTDKYLCREIPPSQVSEYQNKRKETEQDEDTNGTSVYYALGGGTVVFLIYISSYLTYKKMCKGKSNEKIDQKQPDKFRIKFTMKKDDRSIRKLVLNNSPNIEYNVRPQQTDDIQFNFFPQNNFNCDQSEQGSNIYDSPRSTCFVQDVSPHYRKDSS